MLEHGCFNALVTVACLARQLDSESGFVDSEDRAALRAGNRIQTTHPAN